MARLPVEAATALAQTSGFSRQDRDAILTFLREQVAWCQAADHAHSGVLEQIGAREFEWPEFDRWHTIFARRGVFPPLWDGLQDRPCQSAPRVLQQAYQKRKLGLLIDWLHALVATRAEVRDALTRYALRGLQAHIIRQHADIACPVCDPLNHENVQRDSRDVPPFHPGCRCLILVTQPVRPPGATDAAAGGSSGQTRRPRLG